MAFLFRFPVATTRMFAALPAGVFDTVNGRHDGGLQQIQRDFHTGPPMKVQFKNLRIRQFQS